MLTRKCQKQAETKRDGVINPQNYNFNQNFNLHCLHNIITFKGFSRGKITLLDREKIAFLFNLNVFENWSVRLYDSCDTDWGRSIKLQQTTSIRLVVVNLFTGPPYISYIYNKQCWVISIINNVGSVISPWFLQPIRTPCHVKMIFWGPSNAFMRREIKNTKLRTANSLFFVLHFINRFHTVKTIMFVWKTLYFFRSPKCYRERTYSFVSLSVA